MPKAVDNIVKTLKKENPSWSKAKVYAIAWATYKKSNKK